MNPISLNNKVYIQVDELVREHPDLFKEGKKKSRQVLQYKKIPQEDYIFASFVKSNWKISTENNNRAKLFITKTWVDTFFSLIPSKEEEKIPFCSKQFSFEIKEAPPVLKLKDSEKFKDKNGKVLEIEVKGKREEENCFFRVKDVQTCFEDISLYKNIDRADNVHTSYQFLEDFIYFYRLSNRESTKELFFTYQGILKYMFISQNQNTKSFRKWATKVLFTLQIGTYEQKQEVVSELLGVPIDTTIQFMNTCVKDTPLVYMLHLGKVPENIQIKEGFTHDDFFFCKVGGHGFDKETKQGFIGRCRGHQKEFREFKNEMSYLHFVFIDPMYVSEAERSIKKFLKEFQVDYHNKSEVYLIQKKKMDDVKNFFKEISNLYSGNASDMQREMDLYKHQTQLKIKEIESENRHLRDKLEMFQKFVDELKERIAEQANVIKMFFSKLSPSTQT